jgi:serine/threonine protein kinase
MRQKAADFAKTYDDVFFPEALLAEYIPMECLARSPYCETYLLREKAAGKSFVVKCYSKENFDTGRGEGSILKELAHEGLPRFAGEFENADSFFILREYMEGVQLDEWLREGQRDTRQLLEVALGLCDILIYLHGRTPPVIHRDIKPSNVIIDDGKVRLIDFSISRRWSSTSNTDTVYFGTKSFAPPEQFGYSQTDRRTDIYAFGVVLHYMFSGELDVKRETIRDSRLWRIIKKCTAFSPEDRFQDIRTVRQELLGLTGIRRYKRLIPAGALAAVLIVAAILVFGYPKGTPAVHEDFLLQESITLDVDARAEPFTRAEAAKLIVESLGLYDETAESPFTDVPPDDPYYRYISSAAQEQIMQGYGDGTFLQDNSISPGAYVVILMERALGVYTVTDWTDFDAAYRSAAKAGNTYGIITDAQVALSQADPYAGMTVVPGGIIIPVAPFGAWVEWESSDESVCAVDSGQVTPVGVGTATVTAHYRLGPQLVTDTCAVTVTD